MSPISCSWKKRSRRGYEEYDLLVGHDYYKRLITNAQHTLVWALAGRGLPARLYWAARALYWSPRFRPILRKVEKTIGKSRA